MQSVAPSIGLRRTIGAIVVSLAPVTPLITGVLAEDAPVGEVVPGDECTAEPRPATFLADLIATPVAATPTAPLTGMPQGTPPDAQTKTEIEAAVRQLAACSNTGDLLRALALFTDDYLRRTLNSSGQLTAEAATDLLAPYATPFALAAEQLVRLVEVRDVTVLPDGRVAALSVTDGGVPDRPGLTVDLLIFLKVGDRWLIDAAISNFDQGDRSAATPTPAA